MHTVSDSLPAGSTTHLRRRGPRAPDRAKSYLGRGGASGHGEAERDDIEWTTTERGETEFRRKQLGEATGGEDIGCSLYELPEGRRSWPYHYHTANEEALFVLEGRGILRHDDESVSPAAGDYVALPAGERGGHRVANDSRGRYGTSQSRR